MTDPDGDALTITVDPTTLTLGANTVTVEADDGNGGMCSIDITVNVVDDTDPVITPIANAIELWPPNHKYVTIDVSDGKTKNDIVIASDCASVDVRRERQG